MRSKRENGVALITTLLILILVSAMIVGMSWLVMTDTRMSGNNQDRETAFYGAEAGMEKLTADMGTKFATQGFVTAADINAAVTAPPNLPGIQFMNGAGASTYTVTCPGCPAAPVAQNGTILPPSPYAGMQALITPFTLTVAAQTFTGSEVKLQRQIHLVAIPVFQFGIFSQTDLSFFNGPPFDFGGRIHTNGNLWLATDPGPLYLGDKITVAGQVVRSNLENGYPQGGTIAAGGAYGGPVNIANTPLPIPPNPVRPPYVAGQWTALTVLQGSVMGPTVYGQVNLAAPNTANWNAATPVVNGMLQNNVPQLNLTSTALNGIQSPITLIERPVVGERNANPAQFNQRYFSQASLRILVDDYPAGVVPGAANACQNADMMALSANDTVTPTIPVDLATLTAQPAWWNAAVAPFYPLPTSNAAANYATYTTPTLKDGYWQVAGKPIITGCIKIEYQTPLGAWTDVTQEILNLGFDGKNLNPPPVGAAPGAVNQLLYLSASGTVLGPNPGACTDPNPNAVIRIARLRDNPSTAYAGAKNGCTFTTNSTDYWPMVLYDPREAISRDVALPNNAADAAAGHPEITAQGVMNYMELDVNNLTRWFTGAIGASGTFSDGVGGYAVYFSDRRGNQIDPVTALKTGSYGFNDIINGTFDPANGCPNNAIDAGEDFVGDGNLRTYGGVPLIPLYQGANPNLAIQNLSPTLLPNLGLVLLKNPNALCSVPLQFPSPIYIYKHNQEARENPPVFFRRALKLVNGKTINLGTTCFGAGVGIPPCGLTIVAEDPVYIQGEYNDGGVNNGTWAGAGVAASVVGDAVTFLSNNWNDVNSFISPYAPASRPAATTSYRTAVISGKGIPFQQPVGTGNDYGTDGGLHNFLRYIESWAGQTLYYRGSLVSFYFGAQALGPYKCCNTVYQPPSRTYGFDESFTNGPQWLPPRTPTLRSINTVGFSQEIMPTQ